MRQVIAFTLAVGLTVAPAFAQQENDAEVQEGFSLMEEGARMLMRGLMTEMEPAISELRDAFEEMGPALGEFVQAFGPALTDLLSQVDDFSNYEAPEFLPNGDIIIRRKPAAPIWEPDPDTGEIEL